MEQFTYRAAQYLAVTLFVGWPVLGQVPADVEPGDEVPADKAEAARREASANDGPGRGLAARLKRLERELDDRLELSAPQRKAIHRLIAEYLEEISTAEEPSPEQEELDERLAELRDELTEAREAQDMEAMQKVRAEMREVLQKKRTASTSVSREFLASLEEELDEDQVAGFRELVRELDLEPAGGAPTMQQLMRALMQPDVALTADQRAMVRDKMRDAMTSMSDDEQAAADMSGAAARMKAEILAELSPVQRAKVEAHLKETAAPREPPKPRSGKPAQADPGQAGEEEPPDE